MGTLRHLGGALVLLFIPAVFLSDVEPTGWGVVPTQVVPALVMFMLWLLLFDIVMSRVFAAAYGNSSRKRYRRVLFFDLTLLFGLLVFWGPFYLRLLVD